MQNEKLHTTTCPSNAPETELYRFGADGNLRMYSYDRLFYSLYGYDGGTTRTYKYSMDLSPNWVNGRLESVNFNLHTAMFYPNSYLNFNQDGYYTKHYYNGMERIASRLGDQNISINVNDPELQNRKEWQDSLIRKSVVEITGYQFLEPGQEQDPDDPKPIFELPQVSITNLVPNTSSIYYYHSNHLGSTCYVTDGNASVVQGFLYAPFGEITNEHNVGWQSGTLPKYSFNAKELDEETGMYYYEARYYAPPVFTSRDPLFEKYPTFSPYTYCANNPVKYVDPDGREVYVNGSQADMAVERLQTEKMNITRDSETGKLYVDIGNYKRKHLSRYERMIYDAIQNEDITIQVTANPTHKAKDKKGNIVDAYYGDDGKEYATDGGSFHGTTYFEQDDGHGCVYTRCFMDVDLADKNGFNQGVPHEISEQYILGKMSIKMKRDIAPAFVEEYPTPEYDKAHNKKAIPQTAKVGFELFGFINIYYTPIFTHTQKILNQKK